MRIIYYIPSTFDKKDSPYKFISGLKKDIQYKIVDKFNDYLTRRLSSNIRNFHIAHLYNPPKSILRFEKLFRRFRRIKVIVHFTDIPSMEKFDEYNKSLKNVPDLFLFPHSELLKIFRKNIKARGKTELMINGVEEDSFYPQALKQLSFKKEILSVGDFYTGAKAYILIEMMKYLPSEYFLTFMGKIYEQSVYDQIRDLISNLGVGNKVQLITDYDEKVFKEKCQESNIFVTPSKEFDEIFKAHEALLNGTIVLYPLDEYKLEGLFTMESLAPKIIAKQIKTLCEGDHFVNVRTASQLFSWKTRVREMESIYERLWS